MRMKPFFLIALLAGCAAADDTVSGFLDPQKTYLLSSISGAPFVARATITFPGAGRVVGEAPCNRWSGAQSLDYPLVKIGPILSTKRSCEQQAEETAFFAALETMKRVEATGNVVILSDGAGTEMMFRAEN